MMKIITVIGARPQIIKAAALSRAVSKRSGEIQEVLVHTGQHYDENMSEVFFDELGIPKPDYNLAAGSGKHGVQTAKMMVGIEEIIEKENPDAIVVYGDTNSTLAAAMVASKIHIPIVHVEAGLRSFNKKMPEEINRIMCDHASTLLFSPTVSGLHHLQKEGFSAETSAPFSVDNPKIYHCGDVMYDNSLYFAELSAEKSTVLEDNELIAGDFILATIHRNDNTDKPENLTAIFRGLLAVVAKSKQTIVLPLHPRTAKLLEVNLDASLFAEVSANKQLKIIPPVSFLDMIALEKNSTLVITDSGGVQKEAFYFEKPCIILRPETEWVELVENGNAVIVGADETKLIEAYTKFSTKEDLSYPSFYGDGAAAEFICNEIIQHLG